MMRAMPARGLGFGTAVLVPMVACNSPVIIDDWGTAGYAVVQGEVVRANGAGYSGDVFLSCGLEEPGLFANLFSTTSPGRYRAELAWPDASMADTLSALEWKAICRVSAPGSSPPFASAVDTVVFAPSVEERVENTIDIREAQGQ